METKVNKGIRGYKKSVCFDLTAWQLICALLLAEGSSMALAGLCGRCLGCEWLLLLTAMGICETI